MQQPSSQKVEMFTQDVRLIRRILTPEGFEKWQQGQELRAEDLVPEWRDGED